MGVTSKANEKNTKKEVQKRADEERANEEKVKAKKKEQSAKEKEVKTAKTAERAKKSVERSAKKAKKDKERENKAVVKAEKSKKVAEKLKAEKAKEGAQKAAAAKEALDKEKAKQAKAREEARQRKLKEKKQKAAKAEQNEKEKEQKAREKDSKEKKAKNVAREKKRKEHAQKAKEKKSKRDAEESAKEKATKIAEKAAKQKVKENKKKAQRRELAEKRAQELEEKSKEKAEKDAKRAKEKAKKEAASKEKTRKAECKLKKLNREKHIKAAYPKKLSISYRGGWKYYGNQYAPLAVYAKGNVCQLEGTLRKTKNSNIVAKLNDHRCRPSKTLYFPANHGNRQVAIKIDKAGFVRIGSYKPSSFSLSGLVWTRGNYMMMEESTELLETGESDGKTSKGKNQWSGAIEGLNGWQQKKTAISHKHGNLCVLAGQMEGQTWIKPSKDVQGTRYIAKLDGPCRPYKRLMFSTYGMPGGVPLRVDVLPDGRIEVEDVHNRALEPIVNLDGIVFSTVKGSKIKLNTGFTSYGQGYMRPQARQENGICHVQGLAKGSVSPRKVATLPTWCRPARTLSFNAPNNRYVHQLDVLPNGDVMLKSGANGGDKGEKGWKGASFVSLSQITFPIPYESAYGAIM